MIFSHGRRMTRLCSCTARLLSTQLLGIPHMVRVRVLLSDHSGCISFSPSVHLRVPTFPIFKSPPLYLRRSIPFRYVCPGTTAKSCAHDLMTLLRPFTTPNESTRLVHFIAFLCSPATPFAIYFIMYHTLVFCSECANLVKCFAGNRDLPLLHLFLIAFDPTQRNTSSPTVYISQPSWFTYSLSIVVQRCTRNRRQ